MSDDSSKTDTGDTTNSGDGVEGVGPTEIPEESVPSESDLALDNLDARRMPGDKQGDQ